MRNFWKVVLLISLFAIALVALNTLILSIISNYNYLLRYQQESDSEYLTKLIIPNACMSLVSCVSIGFSVWHFFRILYSILKHKKSDN